MKFPAGKLVPWVGGLLHRAWHASRRMVIVLAVLATVLLAARLALPEILRWQINQRLARIPDYDGFVESVDVAIYRGAYVLRDVVVTKTKTGSARNEPFFSARKIDFSLAWRELFQGKIVSDIYVDGARLNFIKAPTVQASQLAVDRRWQDAVKDVFPIEITHFEITDGRLNYRDTTSKPEMNIFVHDLRAVATGLRNRSAEAGEEMPARLTLEGRTVGLGRLIVTGQGAPLAAQPQFECRATLQGVALPALNDALRSYARIDVASGNFQLYFELAAKDGRFQGYAKPFFSQVRFSIANDPNTNLLEKTWRLIASGLVALLKNKDGDHLAMRVPFSGEFGRTDVGVWATITSMLRNGFIEALPPVLERSVKSATIPPANKPVTPPAAPVPAPASKPAG